MHTFHCFDAIYIINLESRADRRREMDEQLRRIGLALTAPPIELFKAVRPIDAGGFPSIGARGCFLSHLGVLRHAQAAGYRRIAILEDDLNFSDDFNERALAIANELAEVPWGMFYGGYGPLDVAADAPPGLMDLPATTAVRCTHFLGFQGAAIGQAANFLQALMLRPGGHPEGGPMHVDGAYSWFRRTQHFGRTLLAHPALGYQRASRTDIHANRWFDDMPLLRSAVGLLRRLKNA